MKNNAKKAYFGFKEVNIEAKEPLVQEVFTQVASKYDIMNDFMSFGMHRLWKQALLAHIRPAPHEVLLDVAGGTGDIAAGFLNAGGLHATVCDLNQAMLDKGKEKLQSECITWKHGNAEKLPFDDEAFDYYTISFGIRNVTNIEAALLEAKRVLKKGGKLAVLEFSNVTTPLIARIYDYYSFKIIPLIGKVVANNEEAYNYLVQSIVKFKNAEEFKNMIQSAGFNNVTYQKLTFGVVAIHTAYRLDYDE